MAFLGFLSINRAMKVYILVLFRRDCLQMLVFSRALVKYAVIFDCKRVLFYTKTRLV